MPDFNKGDFTQQGVNGHVNATVRLNEKRLVNIDLTSNEEAEGCTITGQVIDMLNNVTYPLASPQPAGPTFIVPEQTVDAPATGYVAVEGVDISGIEVGSYVIAKMTGEAYGSPIVGYTQGKLYQDNPGDPKYTVFVVPFSIAGTPVTIQIDIREGAAGDDWGLRIFVENTQTAFSDVTISAIPGF